MTREQMLVHSKNIEDLIYKHVSRVFSLSFASILFELNKDSEEWDTPNSTIFATLLSMFSLFDQCAVLLCNKLGEMISPEEAVFFGVKANQTVIELANRTRPEHVGLCIWLRWLWRKMAQSFDITTWKNCPSTRSFFKSDLEKISHFIIEKGFKTTERDIYLSNNGNRHIHAFDFMCFLVFASEKLTSLVRLIQCY